MHRAVTPTPLAVNAESPPIVVDDDVKPAGMQEPQVDAVSSTQHLPHPIYTGAKFNSFADFETAFERWKRDQYHPFRVASSETLKMPDGSTSDTFKYRYIVYHCAHYGMPRMRGAGKRPNQSYLPCGCRAMLRLNYSWSDNVLRITTLNADHVGHEMSPDSFQLQRFSCKIRRSMNNVGSKSEDDSGGQNSPMSPLALSENKENIRPLGVTDTPLQLFKSSGLLPSLLHPWLHASGQSQRLFNTQLQQFGASLCAQQAPSPQLSSSAGSAFTGVGNGAHTPSLAAVAAIAAHQRLLQQRADNQPIDLSVSHAAVKSPSTRVLQNSNGQTSVPAAAPAQDRHKVVQAVMHDMVKALHACSPTQFDCRRRQLQQLLNNWQQTGFN